MAKVLVSFDDLLLRRIDRGARSQGMSRSGYLGRLAQRDLDRIAGPGSNAAPRRALANLDRLFSDTPPHDSTATIRDQRDAR